MSYNFTISGHSPAAHNEAVKAVFENAVRELRKLPESTTGGTGYTSDSTGTIQLTSNTVDAETVGAPNK